MLRGLFLIFFSFAGYAQEPNRFLESPDFSEVIEDAGSLAGGTFSGLSAWRFRCDKPNAETFGVKTPSRYFNPLYLYNRTSLSYIRSDTRASMHGIFIRRDETSQGASEPPVTWSSSRYFIRHAALELERPQLHLIAGDFIAGWGQGLISHASPSNPFRPFLVQQSGLRFKPLMSTYENLGLRGAAVDFSWRGFGGFAAVSDISLDGRVDERGNFTENLSSLSAGEYGELGRDLDWARRDSLRERSVLTRASHSQGDFQFGISWAEFFLDRFVQGKPSLTADLFSNNWEFVFKGRRVGLWGLDSAWNFSPTQSLLMEIAWSRWGNHLAPGAVLGWNYRNGSQRAAAGLFHLDPYFVSRLADAPRLREQGVSNRQGAFALFSSIYGRQDWSVGTYAARNLRSDFSGSSLSHSPYDPRWTFQARLDDKMRLGYGFFFYAKVEGEQSPYLVDAKRDPRVVRLWETQNKFETSWERRGNLWAVGWNGARLSALEQPSQSAYGRIWYLRSRLKGGGLTWMLKAAFFDLGKPLWGQRFLYISSPEFYWSRLTMNSIAYQSLYASYAPKGVRLALAAEKNFDEFISLYVKLGSTFLSGRSGAIKNTEERDDFISRLRLDFKTELVFKW